MREGDSKYLAPEVLKGNISKVRNSVRIIYLFFVSKNIKEY